ncbi:FAD-binding oxidoreductase [Bacillaceae bacterium]
MKTLGLEAIKQELVRIAGNDANLVQQGSGSALQRDGENAMADDGLGNGGRFVVSPQGEEQIREILRFAYEHSLTVIPEGGGTKRGFGGTLEQADILLSLRRIKGVVEHSAGDLVMTVKAGTTLAEIQGELAKRGQFLPLDAPFPEKSTIGGIIASNASGPKRLRYGSCRDLVIGLRVVRADGTIIRTGAKVVKNVAGYDMNKLFVGSMGTLGVITEIHLKLKPLPAKQSLLLLESPTAEEIADFSRRIMDSTLEPVALEILNPRLAEKLAGLSRYVLAVSFEDVTKAVAAQEEWVRENLGRMREAKVLHDGEAAAWWLEFAASGDAPFALKAGSRFTDVIPVIAEAEKTADRLGLHIRSHGGTGLGISRIYIEERDEGKFLAFLEGMRRFMAEREGYVIVEKAPYAVRRKTSVWGEIPPYFRLLEGIKRKLDPRKVLNPGRFVGGI